MAERARMGSQEMGGRAAWASVLHVGEKGVGPGEPLSASSETIRFRLHLNLVSRPGHSSRAPSSEPGRKLGSSPDFLLLLLHLSSDSIWTPGSGLGCSALSLPLPLPAISPRAAAVSAHTSPKSRKQSRTRQLPGMLASQLATQVKAEVADEIWCLLCRDTVLEELPTLSRTPDTWSFCMNPSASLSFCCVPLGVEDLTAKAARPGGTFPED